MPLVSAALVRYIRCESFPLLAAMAPIAPQLLDAVVSYRFYPETAHSQQTLAANRDVVAARLLVSLV